MQVTERNAKAMYEEWDIENVASEMNRKNGKHYRDHKTVVLRLCFAGQLLLLFLQSTDQVFQFSTLFLLSLGGVSVTGTRER